MSVDIKQPVEESIQTEKRTCVKNAKETSTDAQDDERTDVGSASQTDV